MFGGGGASFCARLDVVLRGRIEAMRLVRMKDVRRDIMMVVIVWVDLEIVSEELRNNWNASLLKVRTSSMTSNQIDSFMISS